MKNTQELKIYWEELLEEVPDYTRLDHFIKLRDNLIEQGHNRDDVDHMIITLTEEDLVKNKTSGSEYVVKTHNPKTQTLVKKDATPEDIKAAEKKSTQKSKMLSKTKTLPDVNDYEEKTKKAKQITNELYGDKKKNLLQTSKDSLLALNKGYKAGADHVAPGNAGSNFNENMSNEASLILQKFPDLDEFELSQIIFERTKDTVLGKQQKKTTVEGGNKAVVPKSIPTSQRDAYRASIIAARSGIQKNKRAKEGIESVRKDFEFSENNKQLTFGGTSKDLKDLSKIVNSSKKFFVYDKELKQSFELPKEVLSNWVSISGGGENAADTTVVTVDSKGNLIFDGWSDKKGLKDIQGNSTLNEEFTSQLSRVDSLLDNDKMDKQTAKKAVTIISKGQDEVEKIEDGYKNAVYKEGQFFEHYSSKLKANLVKLLNNQEKGYISAKTSNHIAEIKNKTMKNPDATTEEVLEFLINSATQEKMGANSRKVLNRLAGAERSRIKKTGKAIPKGLDTLQIMSDSRDKALAKQKEVHKALNELKGKTSSGKSKPLGDLLSVKETRYFLHLDKINKPKSKSDYKQMLKRNTELVMNGIAVPPKHIKECLGVKDFNDYEDNFEVVMDEKIIKDRETSKYTTGKVVQIFAVTKEGKRKFIGEKRYRSKGGPTGNTSNTIAWSPEMQNCFNSKRNN